MLWAAGSRQGTRSRKLRDHDSKYGDEAEKNELEPGEIYSQSPLPVAYFLQQGDTFQTLPAGDAMFRHEDLRQTFLIQVTTVFKHELESVTSYSISRRIV